MNKGKYDVLGSCNYCGSRNVDVKIVDTIETTVSEATTVCKDCGNMDFWAYGYYESGEGKCKRY